MNLSTLQFRKKKLRFVKKHINQIAACWLYGGDTYSSQISIIEAARIEIGYSTKTGGYDIINALVKVYIKEYKPRC